MKLVRDPSNKRGGWALIRLSDGVSGQTNLTISREGGEFSLGPHGWQGGEHLFGPYAVESDDKGPYLRIGPEIVDYMEEYLSVNLGLPDLGLTEDISWPDQIRPSPAAAKGGGVGVKRMTAVAAPERAVPPSKEPPETEEPVLTDVPIEPQVTEQPIEPERPPIDPEPTNPPAESSGGLKWLILLLLLAVIAVASYFAFFHEWDAPEQTGSETIEETDTDAETDADTQTATETQTEPEPQAVSNLPETCEQESIERFLAEEGASAGDLHTVAKLCSAAGNSDLHLRLIEELVKQEDPAGLLQWARWYDESNTDGSSPFAPDAATAAEYFKRAAEAGSQEAIDALSALCSSFENSSNPMADVYRSMHCQ